MRPTVLAPAFILFFASTVHAQYKVGDTVIVIDDETPITFEGKVLEEVDRGLDLKVVDVNGEQLWVSHTSTGWISKQHVATPDNAIDAFTEQIRKNPKDLYAYVARGMVLDAKGELDLAISDYNEVIRLDPNASEAFNNRGNCWFKKGEATKAIQDYSEAIRLDPKEAMIYNNRARAWNKKSEFFNAIADATEAIRLAPRFRMAYQNRADGWVGRKKYDKAISDFSEAIKIDPKDVYSYRYRGLCWSYETEFDKAISDFNEAIALDPKDTTSLSNRAYCWWRKRKYDKAISGLEEAIKTDPKDVYSLSVIAWVYATCPVEKYRNGQKAVEHATKACELANWKDASPFGTLAAAYAEAGDFKRAVQWQTKAIDFAPEEKKADYKARLAQYRSGKAFREEP